MSDDADDAQPHTDAFLRDALQRVRIQPAPANHTGLCRNCGAVIEPERLAANPAAPLCIDCAEEAELAGLRKARTGR